MFGDLVIMLCGYLVMSFGSFIMWFDQYIMSCGLIIMW